MEGQSRATVYSGRHKWSSRRAAHRLEGPFRGTLSRGFDRSRFKVPFCRFEGRLKGPSEKAVETAPSRVAVSRGSLEGQSKGAVAKGRLEGPPQGAFSRGRLEGRLKGPSEGAVSRFPPEGLLGRARPLAYFPMRARPAPEATPPWQGPRDKHRARRTVRRGPWGEAPVRSPCDEVPVARPVFEFHGNQQQQLRRRKWRP
jgi:hypothetical protein